MTNERLISVVVPIYCEEDLIAEVYARMTAALEAISSVQGYELIFVDDGSADKSVELLRRLAERDPRVTVIALSRNFGHQIAITAGVDYARGDAVVVIDGDLQDPPEVIAEMVELWDQGYQVVYGTRAHRDGESAFKLITAKLFYRMMNTLSDIPLPLDTGDFRLMDRAVVDVLKEMREETRYVRGMVVWVGFRQIPLNYARDARYAGETKYTLSKMVRLAFSGISSFSAKPLHLSGQLGLVVTTLSFAYGAWLVLEKILNPGMSQPGWTSVLVAILFLGGVQLISIGVLGAYLGRVFAETKRRPLYVVSELLSGHEDADGASE